MNWERIQKIDPAISVTTENIRYKDKIVVIINVPDRTNKFYISKEKAYYKFCIASYLQNIRKAMYRFKSRHMAFKSALIA